MVKIPPYLKRGDTIGVVCPAGFMAFEKAAACIRVLQESWGYHVKLGKTMVGTSENYFSGTDEERCDDLQAMMDDPEVNAILCGRGGYGSNRIIDRLDFKKFRKDPKWIIGFSDITLLHCHLNKKYRIASLHAPMAAAFNDDEYLNQYVESLHKALQGRWARYQCAPNPFNRNGEAEGELIGGNLTLLAHSIGTKSEFKSKGRILFIEDIGEYIYSIDRMMIQLKRSGKLKNLAGLVMGRFADVKDTDRPFGKSIPELVMEHVAEYDYPVCFDFPVSHDKENFALKTGATYKLTVGENRVILEE